MVYGTYNKLDTGFRNQLITFLPHIVGFRSLDVFDVVFPSRFDILYRCLYVVLMQHDATVGVYIVTTWILWKHLNTLDLLNGHHG